MYLVYMYVLLMGLEKDIRDQNIAPTNNYVKETMYSSFLLLFLLM